MLNISSASHVLCYKFSVCSSGRGSGGEAGGVLAYEGYKSTFGYYVP